MQKTKSLAFIIFKFFVLLFLCSIVIFAFSSANVNDIITANYGPKVASSLSVEQINEINSYWQTNVPLLEKYLSWLSGILRGDLGQSLKYNDTVVNVITSRGLASFFMILIAWIISSIVGFALGVLAGVKENSLRDKIISNISYVLACTPTFFIGMLLLFVFAITLKLFPIGFASSMNENNLIDTIWHAFLPSATLSIIGISNVSMHTRKKTIEIMKSDYITHAKMKGLSGPKLFREHIIRNVSIPAISIQFAQISEIISGSVVIETVFSYPGLGNTLVEAAISGDVYLLAGIALLCTTVVFIANLVSDLIVRRIDPRIA